MAVNCPGVGMPVQWYGDRSYRFEKENVKYFIKDYLLIKAQVLGQRNETLVLQF